MIDGSEPLALTDDEFGPTQVESYLRLHPDFLANRPDLFLAMTPPNRWREDGVVDLNQHIVRGLRTELDTLRTCAREVVDVSRVNLEIQSRAHAAVLSLLGASGLSEAANLIRESFPRLLNLAAARVVFERLPEHADIEAAGLNGLAPGTVDRLIGSGKTVSLVGRIRDDGTIFDADAPYVRSAALARLQPFSKGAVGLFALGGAEILDFNPGQATELVSFLARVVERCIHAWLERRG